MALDAVLGDGEVDNDDEGAMPTSVTHCCCCKRKQGRTTCQQAGSMATHVVRPTRWYWRAMSWFSRRAGRR